MNAPIRFSLVSTFFPPHSFGGDAVHVAVLADGLSRRGHDCRVIHAPDAFAQLGGQVRVNEAPPSSLVVPIRQRRHELLSTYLLGGSRSVSRRLTRELVNAQVVHFHNPSLLGGPRFLREPVGLRVYTTHEHWLVCPMHVLFRNNEEPCTRQTCVRCSLHHHRPPQLWRYSNTLSSGVASLDLILTPSRFTADRHRAAFPGAPIEVLSLPGPTVPLDSAPAAVSSRPYVIYAGRFEPIKGVLPLVEAYVRAAGVAGVDLVVVGEGSQRAALEEIARDRRYIRVLAQTPHAEVLSLIAGALAIVVPSVGFETYGGVAVEAMAFGVPALVRDLGALPELVERGGGLTFRNDDEIPPLVARLRDDSELRANLRREARTEYVNHRSEPVFFRRYFELLAAASARRGLTELAECLRACADKEQVTS